MRNRRKNFILALTFPDCLVHRMVPPGPLVYDVVFPINSTAHVVRPEEGDIGTVTVRIEVPGNEKVMWREIEALAAPYAEQRILSMVAPGGGLGPGKVTSVGAGTEQRSSEVRQIPGREGMFVWEVSIQRKEPRK
jgi:hypothetical protein